MASSFAGGNVAKIAKFCRGFLTKPDLFSPKLLVLWRGWFLPLPRPLSPTVTTRPTYFHLPRSAYSARRAGRRERIGEGPQEVAGERWKDEMLLCRCPPHRGTLLIARFVMQIPAERAGTQPPLLFFCLRQPTEASLERVTRVSRIFKRLLSNSSPSIRPGTFPYLHVELRRFAGIFPRDGWKTNLPFHGGLNVSTELRTGSKSFTVRGVYVEKDCYPPRV